MDKIELIKRYYNGKINLGATSQEVTTIILHDEKSTITTERTFYVSGNDLEKIEGTCSLFEFLDNLGGEQNVNFAVANLKQVVEKIQNTYSANFVPERVPGMLIPYAIRINGRYYEYAGNSADDNFKLAVDFIENFNPLLKLNNNMLKKILNSNVFYKQQF